MIKHLPWDRAKAEAALSSARELLDVASFAHIPRRCREYDMMRDEWLRAFGKSDLPVAHPEPATPQRERND